MFCHDCCQQALSLPRDSCVRPVRVCNTCYASITASSKTNNSSSLSNDSTGASNSNNSASNTARSEACLTAAINAPESADLGKSYSSSFPSSTSTANIVPTHLSSITTPRCAFSNKKTLPSGCGHSASASGTDGTNGVAPVGCTSNNCLQRTNKVN